MRVAGQAALLIAKTYKIADRRGGSRESDKDALDVLRLLRGTPTEDLVARFRRLLVDARSRDVARSGLALFREQFSSPHGVGVEMAVRSVGALMDPDEVKGSCTLLAAELLNRLDEYLDEVPQEKEGA